GSTLDLVDWVRRTAQAEANYWQGFTAKQMLVGLVPMQRPGVGYGRTVSGGGATVMVEVGATVEPRRLFNDWVLVHELIHTGIRRATDGAKGLEDCLAGALWNGLDAPQTVQVVDYAAACDRAVGGKVMSELVDRYYRGAQAVDLAALWKELGVALVGGRIAL